MRVCREGGGAMLSNAPEDDWGIPTYTGIMTGGDDVILEANGVK